MDVTQVGTNNNALMIRVSGRMDAVTAPDFEKTLNQWIDDGNHRIVADLSGLEYISSAGLRSILVIAKKLKIKNGKIILAGMEESVHEVFEISGFNAIIPIVDTVDAAVNHI